MIFAVGWNASLFISSIILGLILTIDAFSISIANSLNFPKLNLKRKIFIAGMFGLFQGLMPLIGWVCVHYIAQAFDVFAKYVVPCLAFIVLVYLGIKMIISFKKNETINDVDKRKTFFVLILIQALATSIDALSVGLTIVEYNVFQALTSAAIIAFITFVICLIGVILGNKISDKIGKNAELIGGIILILIGAFIFIKGMVNIFMPGALPNFF